VPSGPVSAWSHEDKIKETLLRSKNYLGPAVGQQIDALISPLNIGILVGTLILWAGAQFVGVGEVVDVILLVVGAAMIGPSIVNVVENLMEFGKCLVAKTDADLDRSAKAFADAVVTGGITIIMAILLRKGAKAAEARVPGVARPSWLEVAKPKGAIGLPSVGPDPYAGKIWSRVSATGTLTRPAGTGGTTMFGDIIYSLDGTATDRQLALLHERLHSALSPRFGILRTLRAQIKWASYSRSVLLKYLEEAMAECYAQLRVNGFKGALTGIKFPLGGRYVGVTVKGLAAEGTAIGTIAVGAQRFSVSIIGGPQTWRPNRLPPRPGRLPSMEATHSPPQRMIFEDVIVTGGHSVTIGHGKSLSAIAGEQYRDERLWSLIWDLNHVKIGDNPNLVRQGLVLMLLQLSNYSPAEIADAHKRSATWRNYAH
jgi:hypothetical protein